MNVSSLILEKHPDLANLINDITSRILSPTGLSLEYEKELEQESNIISMATNKKSYLETKVFYEAIDRLRFLPLETSSLSNKDADLQQRIAAHIDQVISILELRKLAVDLEAPSKSSAHSAGKLIMDTLARDTMDQGVSNQHADMDEYILEQLQPHLSALDGFTEPMSRAIQYLIQERAREVSSIYQIQKGSIEPMSLSEIIPDVQDRLQLLDRIKKENILKDVAIQKKTYVLLDTLRQSLIVLWEIITEFMVQHQLNEEDSFKEYFSQMVESTILKLGILKTNLQESVYDPETVAQLTKVRDALNQQHKDLTSQTNQKAELLNQYQRAGKEFNLIVESYVDIMQRIEIVQDDIRRLRY